MPRRTPCAIAAAAVVLSAALAGCGGGKSGQEGAGVTQSATPTPSADPYASSYVPYPAYAEAARQTGILPDVVQRELGFHDGIKALCRSKPEDFTKLLAEMRSTAATKDEPVATLRAMLDEVSLRLGLACPRRMSDWIAARGDSADPVDDLEPTETPEPIPVASDEPTGSSDSTGTPSADPEYSESNFGPASVRGLVPAEDENADATPASTDEPASSY